MSRYPTEALPIKPGDTILLFSDFSYDFKQDLPLAIGPNVYLNYTPFAVLEAATPSALADYILPGYHVLDQATHCCLHSLAAEAIPPGLKPADIFFWAITALRLRAPIAIRIAGQFELGQEDDLIRNPTLYHLESIWQPDKNIYYSGEDIRVAAEIVSRLVEVGQCNFKFKDAVVLFSQVTCGHSISPQMCYLGLFSVLEFLFGPLKGNKAATLAGRVAQFLSPFNFPMSLEDWLKDEYIHGRSKLVHGLQNATPGRKIQGTRYEAFGRLHEICRLAILGFMRFDNDKLELLSKSKGKELDTLDPANGRFLEEQRAWL